MSMDDPFAILESRITITVQEINELTGLPISNIYKAIDKGELKAKKIGKRILIFTRSFKEWLGLDSE